MMILYNDLAVNFIKKYSVYFKPEELVCKCGCGELVASIDMVKKLNDLRSKVERPLLVTSFYRCKSHNQNVGGAKNSWHRRGLAADIYCANSEDQVALLKEANSMFDGVGEYLNFAHVDLGGLKRRWRGQRS